MSSVVLSGDTSGTVTLAAPSVAGTNTITLPATTGTMLTTGNPQTGSVIQVVTANYGTLASTTSTSFVDSGLTATITPKFSTSKILVLVTNYWQSYVTSGNARDAGGAFKIVRNSTDIWTSSTVTAYLDGGTGATLSFNILGTWSMNYIDSPATTSATTYKVQLNAVSGRTFLLNAGTSTAPSNITLMEIAA
jgi:hypothetical protein